MRTLPYINGNWIELKSDKKIECINPATEEVITRVSCARKDEVEDAVSFARKALKSWKKTSGKERAVCLKAFAEQLRKDKEKLVKLSTLNNGKPLSEAKLDLDDAIATYQYYAQKALELDERQETDVLLAIEGVSSYVRFEPAGIVASIIPWNFPLVTSAWKIAPALAAGCTILLKPAESTTVIELELGRIADEVDLPNGVLNILPGGAEVGELLTTHPKVDKISFTGSNLVGEKVMISAAKQIKNISLELGGKSPIIVFADADILQAVEAVMTGAFFNCGQMCSATSRLIVEKSFEQKLIENLVTEIEKMKVDSGEKESTTMGPMTTKVQYEKVLEYFEIAEQENLERVVGGKKIEKFEKGFFIEPTIYKNVPTKSRLWREEIFGPILCVQTFEGEEEAIELANDTEFGLAATVVSNDEEKLRRVSTEIEAGHIWWNMPQIVPVETSWGGFKKSGIGRELGSWGLDAFLEVKHIDYPS